jgi:DNA repair exonuclease SbcCD ATPase subunit
MAALLFSDLHYSYETRDTCFQVLDFVHKTASDDGLCVYFLGDFWDHVYRRGTLPVDLLNQMVRYFKQSWTVPTIMIPGNHDYYDNSESEHGLETFDGINQIRVYSHITLDEHALFIPYRKNTDEIYEAIQSADPCTLKVIFGHLDTVGAKMNNNKLSTRGCSKDVYPVKTYSGHYHTSSKYGNITYIGSAYQVHLGESNDIKSLCVVDCTDGSLIKTIPIDIGRKQYKISHDVKDLRFLLEKPLKPGDRVVVETSEGVEIGVLEELKRKGVIIDVKKYIPPPAKTARLDTTDDEPLKLWKKYLEAIGKTDTLYDASIVHLFSKEVVKMYTPPMRDNLDVTFECMNIGNFGPFHGEHTIHFNAGMTLVTGKYLDTPNVDSNGVGKSLYTSGAFLWVCTGRTDPRFGSNAKVSNGIISFDRSSTFVILNGTVNGTKFTVSRNMTVDGKKNTHTLMFHMGECDAGNNTTKMTQHSINRKIFGICGDNNPASTLYDFITRTMIWTQRNSPKFLDSSDVSSKNELAMIANVDYWKTLHTFVKSELKEIERDLDKAIILKGQYEQQLVYESTRKSAIKERIDEWHADNEQRIVDIECQLRKLRLPYPIPVRVDVQSLTRLRSTKKNALNTWKNKRYSFVPSHEWTHEWCKRDANNKVVEMQLTKVTAHGQVCDVCLSHISPAQVSVRRNNLAAKRLPMDDLVKARETAEDEYLREQKKEAAEHINNLTAEIEDIDQKLSLAQSVNKQAAEYRNIHDRRTVLTTTQESLQCSQCPHSLDATLAKITELGKSLENQVDLRDALIEKRAWMTTLLQHLGPCGIQSYLLETTSKYLIGLIHSIASDSSFQIDVSDKEKLIKTFNGHPLSALSGGEFQRLQIACFLAYRQLLQDTYGWTSNLLILDEPDTYVDASGVKSMMEMVRKVSNATLVVSHTNSMHRDMTMFDNHVELVRDSTGSRKRKRG